MNIYEELRKIGIMPVIAINDASKAVKLADALCAGGLPGAEVTFRTAAAADAIRAMAEAHPEMLICAGTVLSPAQADAALEAGAKFIVSPGLNPEVVRHCQEKGVAVIPGIQTPTEIELALSLGLDTVKFFPAEPAGGLAMIKALAAPYTMMKFMPTGGVSLANVEAYLKFDKIIAVGGTWMVKADLIDNDKFDEIEKMARDAAELRDRVRG